MEYSNTQEMMETFLEELKLNNSNINEQLINKLSRKIAYNKSVRQENLNNAGKNTLIAIITELLKCKTPFIGMDGKPCVINIETTKIFN